METERERKVRKVYEQLVRDMNSDGSMFDESFLGKITFAYNIQSGGISGTVTITKETKPATA